MRRADLGGGAPGPGLGHSDRVGRQDVRVEVAQRGDAVVVGNGAEVPAEAAAEGVGGAHPHGVRAQAGAGLEGVTLVGERRRYEL